MAITARELVFYIRAEDQASRVVKRVASSFGSLSNIRALENKALQQNVTNLRNVANAQQVIRRNQDAITTAEVQASRLGRLVNSGTAAKGYTMQETINMHQAALSNAATLRRQEELLAQDLDEVRRKGLAASAAIDTEISQAKINRIQSYITEVQNLARVIRLVGVVSIAAFGYAAHAAAQFSTQATLAATQSTVAGKNTTEQVLRNSQEIQQAILKLEGTGKITANLPEQTNATYQIFSGITLTGNQTQQLQKGISLLKEFNKVATANYGFVSLQDVTRAGIALINRFNLSVGQVPAVMNRMQAAVRFGALNMGQFVQGLNQVAPAFNAAGYSIDQMDASMAFISRKFPNVAQGFAGLARLTETLANPKILAGLKDQGVVITDTTGHLKPLDQIISLILTKWPKLAGGGVNLQNFFKNIGGLQSTVQARRAFVSIAQDLSGYQRMIRDVTGDNNELSKSWESMQKSPQVQWTEFVNKLKTVVYEIGIYAIPAFTTLGKPIANLVKWFDGLSSSTKHMIATVGVFGSAGAILGGTLVIIGGSIAKFILTLKELRLLSVASQSGFLGVGAALRLGLIGALIILVPLMIHYHTQIIHVVNSLGGLKTVLGLVVGALLAIKLAPLIDELGLAALKAGTLKNRMLFLSKMGAVTIGITLLLKSQGTKGAKGALESIFGGALVGGAIGGPPGAVAGALIGAAPTFFQLGQKIRHGILGINDTKNTSTVPAQYRSSVALMEAYLSGQQGQAAPFKLGAINSTALLNAYIAGRKAAGNPVITTDKAAAKAIRKAALTANQVPVAPFDINAAIANVEKLRAISEKSPSLANFKAYENARAALEKHFTGTALTALDDYLNSIESMTKKSATKTANAAKEAARVAAAALKQQLKDAASNVMSMYDTLLQQNQSVMGQLFQGPYVQSGSVQNVLQYGGALSGSDLLKDLRSQNTQFTNFYKTIDRLKKRGAPNELIQQLIQAGPQALPAIKALSGMGDQQWKIYIKTFNRGQALLHSQTIDQLKSQLKDYRKYGRSIALQIITGMRDKRLGLANEIQAIIKNMFGINTPVVTKATKKKLADASKAAATKPGRTPHGTYTGSTTHTHPVVGTRVRTTQGVTYNYNVTAPTSEHTSVETQLRHAEFASRTKYKGHH